MPYVQRDAAGKVTGSFANLQQGFAEEWLEEKEASKLPKPQSVANAEARAYLASTDWYVIRQQETGEAMPEKIKKARADARKGIK